MISTTSGVPICVAEQQEQPCDTSFREGTIATFRPWTEFTAWSAAALGALVAAIGAATSHVVPWWAIESAALIALVGSAVGIALACRRELALHRASSMLSRAEAHLPCVLFEAGEDGVISWMSNNAIDILGQPAHVLVGRTLRDVTEDTPLDPSAATHGAATHGAATHGAATHGAADGVPRHLIAEIEPIAHDPAELSVLRGIIRAAQESDTSERVLRGSEARFRRVLDAAQNGMVLADQEGRILLTNDALRHLLGYTEDEIGGLSLMDLVHPSFIDQLMAMMASRAWSDAAPVSQEVQLTTSDGEAIDVEVSLVAIREQGHTANVLIEVRDLTEARRAFEAIRRMSDYDRLTELPNRELFGRHLERALMDAAVSGRSVGVILLDLDRFKLINDTLGHHSGDRLLRAVAERVRASLPPRHLAARFSGDEYLVLCPDISGIAAAEASTRRVLNSVAQPFEVDGHSLQVTATAGIAVFPVHAQDGETLIRLADAALHAAKTDGGNSYRASSNDAEDPVRRRFQLESDLRLAVEADQLTVHYQPQVDPTSGTIRLFEALLRWQHPERGMVSPEEFVPLLEETGLIVEV
ncbi:MAG: diguanylate cyclase, partial [Dehalococcoidia bacterium]